MSEAPWMSDWTETTTLDVVAFTRHMMQIFAQEFRNQADYNNIRAVRYDPNSKLQERVLGLVEQWDGMRTEIIKVLKQQVKEMNAVTPRPSILMKLEDAARPFVMNERRDCAKIAEDHGRASHSGGLTSQVCFNIAQSIRERK
jgi:hypothetical protein